VAKVFATFRVTGQVSNGVARDILARLQSFTAACDAVGVEVKQTVDARMDPEPVPEPVGGFVVPSVLSGGNDSPEAVIPLPADFKIPTLAELDKTLKSEPARKVHIPKVRK
jgi:hypothetical protein